MPDAAQAHLEVLLVEDNPGDEGLLRAALEDVPYADLSMAWENTLEAAFRRLRDTRFDVVLLDLDLGPTRGLTTLARMRERAPEVPVVVLTGRDDAATGMLAVQSGAQDYLTKGRADGEQVWRALSYAVERYRAERTIRGLNETLEHRVELRTRELTLANEEMLAFVRSCAHDLRGPLRTVEGLVTLFVEEHCDKFDADGMDLLERMRRAVMRQEATLSALARFARTASARLEVQPFDLAPIARRIFDELRRGDPARAAHFTCPASLPTFADAGLVEVALENLLSNAWKFTARQAQTEIELGSIQSAGLAIFFVRDNGVGFDPRFKDKLFKPFQRLHDERAYPGTGLGLSTVQRVVRLHGGRVWVEAAPEGGATFSFTLATQLRGEERPEVESDPADSIGSGIG
jgi:hypothetical protein